MSSRSSTETVASKSAPMPQGGQCVANSAGQAALQLANVARSVTVVCRAESLERNMLRYLVDGI